MIDFSFLGKDCLIDKELNNRENLNQKLHELNIDSTHVLLLNQIHGNKVITIENPQQIYGNQNLPKADGIVTNQKNVVIGIVTADCVPVVFWDSSTEIIGACHAGWRGAKSGIIQNTVLAMKNLGATEIRASIGPSIQQYSYEVSRDFFDDFLNENITNKKFFRVSKNADKWLFDLPNYVFEKISNSGVEEIDNCEIDTYTNSEKYFSYRRSTHAKDDAIGRNISIIIAK